jgi:phage shock protein A
MNDAGLALQRAQDKIADMQARAGAIDELLSSGALTDLTSSTDDIQAQLDKVATTSEVDRELAALKAELAPAAPPAHLGPGSESGVSAEADAVPDHPEVNH